MSGTNSCRRLKSVRGDEAAHRKIGELMDRIEQLEGRLEELEGRIPEQLQPTTHERPVPLTASQE